MDTGQVYLFASGSCRNFSDNLSHRHLYVRPAYDALILLVIADIVVSRKSHLSLPPLSPDPPWAADDLLYNRTFWAVASPSPGSSCIRLGRLPPASSRESGKTSSRPGVVRCTMHGMHSWITVFGFTAGQYITVPQVDGHVSRRRRYQTLVVPLFAVTSSTCRAGCARDVAKGIKLPLFFCFVLLSVFL